MQEVIAIVQKVVDIIIREKKDDLFSDAIDLLGQIAKQNIELIAPTLSMFIKLLTSKDEKLKLRVIRGLGEASVQRPGWAYEGIDALIKVTQEDKEAEARRAAIFELHRVAQKEPTMLIEYIGEFINCLSKDGNEQVRRIAASTFVQMAEAIPTEAKEAIPALQDALHDEYKLVRIYADKALSAIRAALR
jgi:HEAT repeat protein